MIVKTPKGWILKSKKTGRILGHHATKKEAVKQEQAIFFQSRRGLYRFDQKKGKLVKRRRK